MIKCVDCRYLDGNGCWYGGNCTNKDIVNHIAKESYHNAINEVLNAIDFCFTQSECVEIIKQLKKGR